MDMLTAHKGRGITEAAFNAVVEDLVATLDKFNVPAKEKSDLLALLGPLKTAVVTAPAQQQPTQR
jgi:hemoglobin